MITPAPAPSQQPQLADGPAGEPTRAAPPPALVPRGTRVGRYVIRGLVGRGAMGEVYRAHDPELGRRVAIKVMRARGTTGGGVEARTRLLAEARAMARICAPNVIPVHDVGTFEDGVFIAMEYVQGSTLGYWLLAAPRTWHEVLRVFLMAGQGLSAAHVNGVVHHDFKPDNVMLGADGQVRVTDFGLARELRGRDGQDGQDGQDGDGRRLDMSSTMPIAAPLVRFVEQRSASAARPAAAPTLMGTPAYMSPEQFLGSDTDERSDQFSFCVALYEALYHRRPFEGQTVLELRGNVFAGRVGDEEPGSPVPRAVRRALLRGMSPHPGHRWPSMAALLQALNEAAAPPPRRRWAAAVAVACAVLSLAGMLAVRGAATAGARPASPDAAQSLAAMSAR